MITIGDITVKHPMPRSVVVYIKQDDDVIVVYRDEIVGLADALREYAPDAPKEPEPAPEKWYVVLDNSNSYLTTHGGEPITFTMYEDARAYGMEYSGRGRRYVPISADEYERAFGR